MPGAGIWSAVQTRLGIGRFVLLSAFPAASSALFWVVAGQQWGTRFKLLCALFIISGILSCASVRTERYRVAWLCVVFILSLSWFAWLRGQDVNWDQLNYHFLNPYLVLNDFYRWNIAPGMGQTWFNPTPYFISFFLGSELGSVPFALFSASLAALSAPIVYLIARELQQVDEEYQTAFAVLATLVGMTAPMYLSEIGTTFFDAWAAPAIAGALLAVVRAQRSTGLGRLILLSLSGLLLGLITGAKLTNGIYLAAMMGAVFAAPGSGPRASSLALFAGAALVGCLATGGWWALFLWHEYGNPFFPIFNGIFQSPFLEGVPISSHGADIRYIPSDPISALGYPIAWAIGADWVSSEAWFRDARFALLLGLLLVAAAVALRRRLKRGLEKREPLPSPERAAWWFFGLAMLLWFATFAIHRYLVPLEVLSGVMLMLVCLRLLTNRRAALLFFSLVSFGVINWGRHPDWGHVPFAESMVPDLSSTPLYEPKTLFVIIGGDPVGFVVPAMPKDARFVRIDIGLPLPRATGIGRTMYRVIASHSGPLRTLGYTAPAGFDIRRLRNFGLVATSKCDFARVLGKPLVACDLERAPDLEPEIHPPQGTGGCTGSCAMRRVLAL